MDDTLRPTALDMDIDWDLRLDEYKQMPARLRSIVEQGMDRRAEEIQHRAEQFRRSWKRAGRLRRKWA